MRELHENGRSSSLELLWELDYVRRPPTIQEFIEDKYYVGEVASSMYDKWKEEICHVHSNDSKIFEWVLSGAIGIGKTWTAAISQLYSTAKLLCLRNPQQYYGLSVGSFIGFAFFNVTKELAYKVNYSEVRSKMRVSPFFQEYMDPNPRSETWVSFRDEYSWLRYVMGSDAANALGNNIFGGSIDEANFSGRSKNPNIQAKYTADVYNGIRERIRSRFMDQGRIPGVLHLISSKGYATNFLERHIEERTDNEGVYVTDLPIWDVKPSRIYSGTRFRVLVGDKHYQTRLLTETEQVDETQFKVINVPIEYRDDFESDPDTALRDLAGIVTHMLGTLIPRKDKIYINAARNKHMKHPFTRDVVTLRLDDEDELEYYLLKDEITAVFNTKDGPRRIPKYYPLAQRHIHIDIATSRDRYGIAMGCRGGSREVHKKNIELGIDYIDKAPLVHIDFMLAVKAGLGSQIDYTKIRRFILFLRTLGFNIELTADSYQSTDTLQILGKQGLDCSILSVDKDDIPYKTLRAAIMEERLDHYEYSIFMKEVSELLWDPGRRKVDHPHTGSKDVADAVCGVVFKSVQDAETLSTLSASQKIVQHIDAQKALGGQPIFTGNTEQDEMIKSVLGDYRGE